MHAFIPNKMYRKYLGGDSFKSVMYATLLGIPLPLCSCGVIPTAMSLRKEGASRGATVSFLIATPQTGVDSIIATYSLMGLPFALLRPIAALVTALFGGAVVTKFDKGGGSEADAPPCTSCAVEQTNGSFRSRCLSAVRYAYVDMMQDIGRWLMVGLVIAGLITVFVPESFFGLFADKSLLSMLLVLAFAIPMYLCATGSIPIAVALMLKGLSPGAALVLLMAGPAVNMASVLVISKVMGKKTMALYLFSIIAGAMAFGLGIDCLLPREWFIEPLRLIHACGEGGVPYFNIGCSIVLMLLLLNAFVLRRKNKTNNKLEKMENLKVIKINGMSCNHCKASAERAIKGVAGVEDVQVDLAAAQATIKGDFSVEDVIKAVEDIGFEVERQ